MMELDLRFRELGAETKQCDLSIVQNFAALIGKPEETDRGRLIWAGIVEYANLSGLRDRIPEFVAMKLTATLFLCTHGQPQDQAGSVFDLDPFDDVHDLAKKTGVSRPDAFLILAARQHTRFREMLAWVADPNRCDHTQRVRALDFLLEQGNEGRAEYQYEVEDKFDDTGNVGYPFFYWKHPRSFATILAPLAKFIIERIESYHEKAVPLDEAMPIILCRRKACGMFAISERKTRDFCSDSCRTLNRQEEKRDEHAAYMRKYRQSNYTKPHKTRRSSGE